MTGETKPLRNLPITTAFVGVFLAITVVGLLAAGWIMLRTPENVREQLASVPGGGAPNAGPEAGRMGGGAPGQLPPGHPKIELPTEARTFIDKAKKEAESKPNDTAAWNKLGTVALRAAMFDESYYGMAADAYGHVLKIDPDNLDALRGIGDIDYDRNKYDEAIAAYEHFLKKKPDDPEVRTDLGTMYLYTGNADQAIVQYKKAIKTKPDFYQGYFNMAVAYVQSNKPSDALAALEKALPLAPDDNTRNQVKELTARINSGSLTPPPGGGAPSSAPSAAAQAPVAESAPGTFHGEIEQMVRGLPNMGPKVGSVQWPKDLQAKVMMDNFPIDQMPPFAKQKFVTDIKAGIESAKKDHKVAGTVEMDIVDSASGRVMQTITD
ncbi:MAG TPA: tetratricopeptide repeat protein [Candidatus Binataceae bacterium]|nr:tetratricopeptide repeat protein [Candidatus Binataceae bacterium]